MNTPALMPGMATAAEMPPRRPVPVRILDIPRADPPMVDIVVPVHNEQADLGRNLRRLHAFVSSQLPWTASITIVDNGSTDDTWNIARRLESELDSVVAMRLDAAGRGRALRAAWMASPSPILAYMDVDLATDLAALLPLLSPLVSGHSQLAIGSRLTRGASVARTLKREVLSRGYNTILRLALGVHVSDAQCGFKAVRRDVARWLLPRVRDQGWFFDTELLVLAQRAGLRIHEVPVDWTDDPDSRVDIVPTVVEDLKGVGRLWGDRFRGRSPVARANRLTAPRVPQPVRRLRRFLWVGAASTAAYVFLYTLLRAGLPPEPSNGLALLVTAFGNTAANRRWTFGIRGRVHSLRHQLVGLLGLVAALAVTTAAIGTLGVIDPAPSRTAEIGVLVAAGAAGTMVRFALLRWVLDGGRHPRARGHGGGGRRHRWGGLGEGAAAGAGAGESAGG